MPETRDPNLEGRFEESAGEVVPLAGEPLVDESIRGQKTREQELLDEHPEVVVQARTHSEQAIAQAQATLDEVRRRKDAEERARQLPKRPGPMEDPDFPTIGSLRAQRAQQSEETPQSPSDISAS